MEVDIAGKLVKITGDRVSEAVGSSIFQQWKNSISSRFVINSVHIQSVDTVPDGDKSRVLFIKLSADVSDKDGNFIPGIVFLRGGAVTMLVVLVCEGREYVVVTKQSRLATGEFELFEAPAGMIDGDGNFSGVAAKEIHEELDLVIRAEDLVDLTPEFPTAPGVYTSPGVSDEFLRLFLYKTEVDVGFMRSMIGKQTGLAEEGEYISLMVFPIEGVHLAVPDAKLLSLLCLYDRSQA